MEYKVVKKKWDSWISRNLANFQGSFRNKSFLRKLQWFVLKNWIDIVEDRDSRFYSWRHHFLQILAYLKHFNPYSSTHIPQNLTSLNFWKAENALLTHKNLPGSRKWTVKTKKFALTYIKMGYIIFAWNLSIFFAIFGSSKKSNILLSLRSDEIQVQTIRNSKYNFLDKQIWNSKNCQK